MMRCDCGGVHAETGRRLTVRWGASSLDGDCNFCDRNIGPNGLIERGRRVLVLTSTGGGGLLVRICGDCLTTLRRFVQ